MSKRTRPCDGWELDKTDQLLIHRIKEGSFRPPTSRPCLGLPSLLDLLPLEILYDEIHIKYLLPLERILIGLTATRCLAEYCRRFSFDFRGVSLLAACILSRSLPLIAWALSTVSVSGEKNDIAIITAAVTQGEVEVFNYVLDSRPSLMTLRDSIKALILPVTAKYGWIEIAKILLEIGFHPRAADCLRSAARNNQLEFLEWFGLIYYWEPSVTRDVIEDLMLETCDRGSCMAAMVLHRISDIPIPVYALAYAARRSQLEFLESVERNTSAGKLTVNTILRYGAIQGGDRKTLNYCYHFLPEGVLNEKTYRLAIQGGSVTSLEWLKELGWFPPRFEWVFYVEEFSNWSNLPGRPSEHLRPNFCKSFVWMIEQGLKCSSDQCIHAMVKFSMFYPRDMAEFLFGNRLPLGYDFLSILVFEEKFDLALRLLKRLRSNDNCYLSEDPWHFEENAYYNKSEWQYGKEWRPWYHNPVKAHRYKKGIPLNVWRWGTENGIELTESPLILSAD